MRIANVIHRSGLRSPSFAIPMQLYVQLLLSVSSIGLLMVVPTASPPSGMRFGGYSSIVSAEDSTIFKLAGVCFFSPSPLFKLPLCAALRRLQATLTSSLLPFAGDLPVVERFVFLVFCFGSLDLSVV
jgi:hypothetical protein